MRFFYTFLLITSLSLFGYKPVRGQFIIEGSVFENYGRINYYGPYTEVSASDGSGYVADFGANFDHFETDNNSLIIHNSYQANGPQGGSSDNFLGPSGLPGLQGVSGSVAPDFGKLLIQNGSNSIFSITNTAGVNVFSHVDFQNGITTTARSRRAAGAIRFQTGATYSGGLSDRQHVNGYVGKTGNQAFVFPVGDGTDSRPLSISAPASASASITTGYDAGNIEDASLFSSPLTSIFTKASWAWLIGAPSHDDGLEVTVSIPDLSGFAPATELRLAGWNGARWIALESSSNASGNTEGSQLTGIIPTGISISRIAIGTAPNSLPLTLKNFTARREGNITSLDWTTSSEINSDYFEIQRSRDASTWGILGNIQAPGYSDTEENYNFLDRKPHDGLNYYRLKMIDKDGTFALSAVRTVNFEMDTDIVLFPNPAFDVLHLGSSRMESLKRMQLISLSGQIIADHSSQENQPLPDTLDISDLEKGIYTIRISNDSGDVTSHKLIKR